MVKKKKKEEKKEKGVAESFLQGIPIVGGFFNELAKTEAFKEKFKEVNKQIEENLQKGHKKEWNIETRVSVRPLFKEARPWAKEIEKEAAEIEIKEDYLYGKKGNKLILIAKVPKEDAEFKIEGEQLVIKADSFQKRISLPGCFKNVKKKKYNKGAWLLELTK